jgi:hypothetical protein
MVNQALAAFAINDPAETSGGTLMRKDPNTSMPDSYGIAHSPECHDRRQHQLPTSAELNPTFTTHARPRCAPPSIFSPTGRRTLGATRRQAPST